MFIAFMWVERIRLELEINSELLELVNRKDQSSTRNQSVLFSNTKLKCSHMSIQPDRIRTSLSEHYNLPKQLRSKMTILNIHQPQ